MVSSVKKCAETILTFKGYIEKVEYIGTRTLPYVMSSKQHGAQRKGRYVDQFDAVFEMVKIHISNVTMVSLLVFLKISKDF